MHKPCSILFLIDSLSEGGAELALLALTQSLCKLNCKVSIFAFREPRRLSSSFLDAGATLYLPSRNRSENRFQAFLRLITVLRNSYFNFVHASSRNTSMFLMLSFILPNHGKRLVTFQDVHFRNRPGLSFLQRLKENSLLFVLNLSCDGFTTDSHTNVHDYKKYSPNIQLIFLPNCVIPPITISHGEALNARKIMNVETNDFVIVIAARYSIQKGHIGFFEAINQIKLRGSSMPKVVCFGEGDQFDMLSDFIGINNLEKYIFLNHVVSIVDLQAYMLAADLIVLPSLWESFGQVVVGAMELGMPVLGSDTGGIREQIIHNQTGFLAPPGHVSAWSNEIERLMNSPSMLANVGNAARESVSDKMTSDQIAIRLTDFYTSL